MPKFKTIPGGTRIRQAGPPPHEREVFIKLADSFKDAVFVQYDGFRGKVNAFTLTGEPGEFSEDEDVEIVESEDQSK